RVRDALHPGGRVPLGSRRGDVAAAGSHHPDRRRAVRRRAGRGTPRGARVLRAGHGGARGASRHPGGEGGRAMTADRISRVAAPVVVGLLLLGLWQLLIGVLRLGPATIPTPAAVAAQYGLYTDIIVEDALITGSNSLAGL